MPNKTDYQKKMERILAELPAGAPQKPSLLLHACCGPCSSAVIELLASHFAITVYYYNPNIYPPAEYERRKQELLLFLHQFPPAAESGIRVVEAAYEPEDFFRATNAREEPALQQENEKGERCRRCYLFRMAQSYSYACEHHFDYFTTTLSISPHKDSDKINTIGESLAHHGSTQFLFADFKKKNGFLRSLQLSAEYGLYRQDYCGCVYSKQNRGVQ